jgi:hypothetical protein
VNAKKDELTNVFPNSRNFFVSMISEKSRYAVSSISNLCQLIGQPENSSKVESGMGLLMPRLFQQGARRLMHT